MFDIVTDIPQPKDRGIMFKDIITDGTVERVKALALLESESRACTSQDSIKKRASKEFINIVYQINPSKESNGQQPFMQNRIYDVKGKSVSLTECMGHKIKYQTEDKLVRTVNQIEMERLQGFPDGYTSILSKAKAGSLLGDGWTLPIIEHIFSFI